MFTRTLCAFLHRPLISAQQLQKEIARTHKTPQWHHFITSHQPTLRRAILGKNHEVAKVLLPHISPRGGREGSSRSLIELAAQVGDLKMVKFLEKKGASSQEAMKAAIDTGHTAIVAYLLKQGMNTEGTFKGRPTSLLSHAAIKGHTDIVKLLVKQGAKVLPAIQLNHQQFKEKFDEYTSMMHHYHDNPKKQEKLTQSKDAYLKEYTRATGLLLDFAQGNDLGEFLNDPALSFLEGINVSRFNFVGVSIQGQPLTKTMLQRHGIKGAEQAFFTLEEINQCKDDVRKRLLQTRLKASFSSQGKVISPTGIVNLVPLPVAVKQGDPTSLNHRLAAGVNPNQPSPFSPQERPLITAIKGRCGIIALRLATHRRIMQASLVEATEIARGKCPRVVTELLDNLIKNINQKDEKGNTLLHYAVIRGDCSQIESLLKRGADLTLKNTKGHTPLTLAITWDNSTELLQILLGKSDPLDKNHSFSALSRAITLGNSEAVKILLPYTTTLPSSSYTSLVDKAFFFNRNWRELCDQFCNSGRVDWNAKNSFHRTFLQELIKQFPSSGPVENTLRRIKSDLYGSEICQKKQMQQVESELIQGAKHSFEVCLEKLDYLLAQGADPCLQDSNGDTALHLFLRNVDIHSILPKASARVIERFLRYGLDPNSANREGITPLDEAIIRNNREAINYLIKSDTKPKSQGRPIS